MYFKFPHYIGYDVSKAVIEQIRTKYENDDSKDFWWTRDKGFTNQKVADMSISLDVIYHLVEDEMFNTYMINLFECSRKYVCIYSWDFDDSVSPHVRYRKFTDYIKKSFPNWKLIL